MTRIAPKDRAAGAVPALPATGAPAGNGGAHGNGAGGAGGGGGDRGVPLQARHPILWLNDEFAVVMQGTAPAVLQETRTADGKPLVRFLTFTGFRDWMRKHPRVLVDGKLVALADAWFGHAGRREYNGICFEPALETPGFYNLWRGWAVEPDPDALAAGKAQRFLDHVYENVCGGSDRLFAWVVGWFAAIVQRPGEKLGTSLVLRGSQGTGKTIVGKTFGSLMGAHYALVADPRFITGRFNAHLAHTLLLQADEGFWAGDHTAEGKLKDLITGEEQLIEYKGREAIAVKNHVRLLITGNARWLVPAGLEERRFAVLDMAESRRQDHGFFGAIRKDMESGGQGALLQYLLDFDLASVEDELRQIPQTAALLDQKLRSLDSTEQWWLDVLMRGRLPGAVPGTVAAPGTCRSDALYEHYLEHAKQIGIPRRSIETEVGKYLKKVVPHYRRVRRSVAKAGGGSEREMFSEFPSLALCRAEFDRMIGHDVEWPDDDGEWPEAPP